MLGWGSAAIIALDLSDWDWGADGLALHIVVIGIPATMTAAVALDLLARPGSLAIGERAGLVTAPRPIRAVRRRIAVFLPLPGARAPRPPRGLRRAAIEPPRPEPGVRVRRVLEDAGGVYVKLGQIAATRVDLLPSELCAELATLQNRVPPESRDGIAAVLAEELGDIDDIFAEFEWEPLAAASIGQTHRARLRTGEAVVVKIQRPGIDATMERDLAALELLADLAQRRTTFGRGLRSGDMLAQFAEGLREELDFRREADAMAEMAARLDGVAALRVPTLHRELSTRRVLVQERFDGRTVSDVASTGGLDADRQELADQLLRSMLDQVMRLGFFHADPHPGNVFVLADGGLGLIDFGAVGRLDPIQRSAVVDMLVAMAHHDVALLRDAHPAGHQRRRGHVGRRPRAGARPAAGRARPTGRHDRPRRDAGARRRARRLRDAAADRSRPALASPRHARWHAARARPGPVVDVVRRWSCWDRRAPTPLVDPEQLVRDELTAMLPHLRRLPERVDRILTLTGRGELRLRTVTDEDSRRIMRTLVNRALLAGIGAAVLAVSAVLLVASDPGPAVAEDTGLFEIFGYGGLLAGAVLVLRVVAAVARDGTT